MSTQAQLASACIRHHFLMARYIGAGAGFTMWVLGLSFTIHLPVYLPTCMAEGQAAAPGELATRNPKSMAPLRRRSTAGADGHVICCPDMLQQQPGPDNLPSLHFYARRWWVQGTAKEVTPCLSQGAHLLPAHCRPASLDQRLIASANIASFCAGMAVSRQRQRHLVEGEGEGAVDKGGKAAGMMHSALEQPHIIHVAITPGGCQLWTCITASRTAMYTSLLRPYWSAAQDTCESRTRAWPRRQPCWWLLTAMNLTSSMCRYIPMSCYTILQLVMPHPSASHSRLSSSGLRYILCHWPERNLPHLAAGLVATHAAVIGAQLSNDAAAAPWSPRALDGGQPFLPLLVSLLARPQDPYPAYFIPGRPCLQSSRRLFQ
jgi:hypothetical protein